MRYLRKFQNEKKRFNNYYNNTANNMSRSYKNLVSSAPVSSGFIKRSNSLFELILQKIKYGNMTRRIYK